MKYPDDIIRELVYENFEDSIRVDEGIDKSAPAWLAMQNTGTRLWLDTGDIEAACESWDPTFEALTTNNSLLCLEVERGDYDKFIRHAGERIQKAAPTVGERTFLREINLALSARHGLKLAKTFNTQVSVELHTDLANEVERSVDYGRRLYALCPEHFIVKVPYTPAGLLAARRLGQEGVPGNMTLGFSARQAYLAIRIANPSYVNVFLGRLNSYVDDNELGTGDGVGEKTTRATQRLVSALRKDGQADTLLIAASMRSANQVSALAGIDVLTMPPAVAKAYREKPSMLLDVDLAEGKDPLIALRPELTSAEFNGATLWNLEEPEHCAISNLMTLKIDALEPDHLTAHFANENVGNFMPLWNLEEVDLLLEGGKIPSHTVWSDQQKSGKLGLDALMNMAALGTFVTDQKKLDERIAQLL